MAEDPRATLGELAAQLQALFGGRLLGLYLFGSLAAGGFYPGKSDIDLIAVLDSGVAEGDDLDSLRGLHERFEAEHPEWRERIEVLYLARNVLATFASVPTGTVARVSPGEPMHHRDLAGDIGWLLDWHGVITVGETLLGPPPLTLGPTIDDVRFRAAVSSQLHEYAETVRRNDVAYFPAYQGYIVAGVCRAMYSLETGRQISKEDAVAWLAERRPDHADFIWGRYSAYRADVRGPHARLTDFVDAMVTEADTLRPREV
jgi:hypothetical protein